MITMCCKKNRFLQLKTEERVIIIMTQKTRHGTKFGQITGFSLVLKGNYDNGKMILKSQLLDGKKGKYYNQITWVKNDDG